LPKAVTVLPVSSQVLLSLAEKAKLLDPAKAGQHDVRGCLLPLTIT